MPVAKITRLFRDKRAVEPVIANLILIAAVIVVGFAVLFWAQYQSSVYTDQYSGIVGSDINQLQERLALEYTNYNSSGLTVYLFNPGPVNVTIQTVLVDTLATPFHPTVKDFISGVAVVPSNTLVAKTGMREGYITILPPSLSSGSHTIKIVTARGSSFVYNFAT